MRVLILALLVTTGAALAQEPPPRPQRGSEALLERVKDRDPERYAELIRLRDKDPEAFRQAIRQRAGEQRDDAGNPNKRKKGRFGPPGPRGDEFMQRLFERLEEKNPERAAELRRLHKENPEAFRQEVRELLVRGRQLEMPREHGRRSELPDQEIDRLRTQYKSAETAAAKELARDNLRQLLTKHFDAEVEKQQERLAAMSQQIELMRQRLSERREQRDSMLDQQLEKVLAE